MVCRCGFWVWSFGRDTYFAHCANVKSCPGSAPAVRYSAINFIPETLIKYFWLENLGLITTVREILVRVLVRV